jgi:uncharacterized protein (DUF1697 family)
MARQVALLRGVNIGPRNRIAMPELRGALEAAGFGDVATYIQSGNVVLSSGAKPDAVARGVEAAIANRFGLEIAVVVRTRAELAAVVGNDPFGDSVDEPKRFQVTFLDAPLSRDVVSKIEASAARGERVVVGKREVYAWHPAGVGRSKLATLLAGRSLGVTATARNWTTVTTLLGLAS